MSFKRILWVVAIGGMIMSCGGPKVMVSDKDLANKLTFEAKKLKQEFADLTPADLQLCAYLKMNLSSKEIASLLNITLRGVEIRRYRLRKKLHLDHNTNLVEFIMGY